MFEQPNKNNARDQETPAPGHDREANLERREALAKLGRYAAAGYIAPAFLTLMVSKKASAASGEPPLPPG